MRAQNFHRLGYISEGVYSHGTILIRDVNCDSFPELYYSAVIGNKISLRIREYRPYNRYILADEIPDHGLYSDDLGDFDNDGRGDLFSWSGGNFKVFEVLYPDPYPTHQVWRSDSSYFAFGNIHVADLDSDGKMDFLFNNAGGEKYIYENIGDNQYILVWDTVVPPYLG
ncbi:hypothetical protein DRP53_04525, partial [candidate division WOR-3 bacterium]